MKRIIFAISMSLRPFPNVVPNNFTGFYLDSNGGMYWLKNGSCHRDNAPAAEYHYGAKSWWLDGMSFTSEKEYFKFLNQFSYETHHT